MELPASGHDPVLMKEVLDALAPVEGKTAVDCTVGRAGHAVEIARRLGKTGRLVALDADPRNLEFARSRLADVPCEVRLFHANFAELPDVLSDLGVSQVDGILAGSAADLVNSLPEEQLANVLYELAQERYSRRIARNIAQQRRLSPITTTERLAEVVRSAIGRSNEKIDPATRTFLALRMAVNQEMENLEALLKRAPGFLKTGGRLAVISFQSMEDRLVKQAFRQAEQTGVVKALTKKPISPAEAEIAGNPRSRSAKMRVVEKVESAES